MVVTDVVKEKKTKKKNSIEKKGANSAKKKKTKTKKTVTFEEDNTKLVDFRDLSYYWKMC